MPDDEILVAARCALLNALEALGPQRSAVILVGAQAIYLHTGEVAMAVAPFTSDADLAIDPQLLGDDPRLDSAMRAAQFALEGQPGIWTSTQYVDGRPYNVSVDLLVPHQVGRGRRGADLDLHGKHVARITKGLEGALVDFETRDLGAISSQDSRRFDVRVAGPGALLVSKLHKIAERSDEPGQKRLKNKDALDVFRLLRAIDTTILVSRISKLLSSEVSRSVAAESIAQLEQLFSRRGGLGVQMLLGATERLEDPAEMTESCIALAADLLEAVRRI